MQCIITTKGMDEFITFVDTEKNETVIYRNKNKIASLEMRCDSAAYDGRRLIYTEKNNGTIFITDTENSDPKKISSCYGKLSVVRILSEFDDLALFKADDKYIILNYLNGKEILDCSGLKLDIINDIYMDKYGIGKSGDSIPNLV